MNGRTVAEDMAARHEGRLTDMSDEHIGSKPWKGSQSEGLHDLGMIVGLVASATESLALAYHIAEVGGLLPDDKLHDLKEAETKASSIGIASVSMARVAELHKKCAERP